MTKHSDRVGWEVAMILCSCTKLQALLWPVSKVRLVMSCPGGAVDAACIMESFVMTHVTCCSSCTVVMLYSVRVKVNTFSLPILIHCPGVSVLDWCAGVWAEIVVIMSLHWLVFSCLLFSQFDFS